MEKFENMSKKKATQQSDIPPTRSSTQGEETGGRSRRDNLRFNDDETKESWGLKPKMVPRDAGWAPKKPSDTTAYDTTESQSEEPPNSKKKRKEVATDLSPSQEQMEGTAYHGLSQRDSLHMDKLSSPEYQHQPESRGKDLWRHHAEAFRKEAFSMRVQKTLSTINDIQKYIEEHKHEMGSSSEEDDIASSLGSDGSHHSQVSHHHDSEEDDIASSLGSDGSHHSQVSYHHDSEEDDIASSLGSDGSHHSQVNHYLSAFSKYLYQYGRYIQKKYLDGKSNISANNLVEYSKELTLGDKLLQDISDHAHKYLKLREAYLEGFSSQRKLDRLIYPHGAPYNVQTLECQEYHLKLIKHFEETDNLLEEVGNYINNVDGVNKKNLSEMLTKVTDVKEKLDKLRKSALLIVNLDKVLQYKNSVQPYIDFFNQIDLDRDLTQQGDKDLLSNFLAKFRELDRNIIDAKKYLDSPQTSKDDLSSNTDMMNACFADLQNMESTSSLSPLKIAESASKLRTFEAILKEVKTYSPVSQPEKQSPIVELEKHFKAHAQEYENCMLQAQQHLECFQVRGKNRDLGKSFQDLSEKLARLSAIKEALDKTHETIEFIKRRPAAVASAEQVLNQAALVRIEHPNEIDQVKQYFLLHYERVTKSLQTVKDHLDNGDPHGINPESGSGLDGEDNVGSHQGVNPDQSENAVSPLDQPDHSQETYSSESSINNLRTLENAVTGLKKALNKIDFRVKYPTYQDVRKSHNPPEESIQFFEKFQDEHWRKIAKKRAEKNDVPFTEDYYQQYLKDLAEKSRDLCDGQPLYTCRELDTFERGLDEGCILSSIETETIGANGIERLGYDSMDFFRNIAKKLFGYNSEELPPEVFFIYACIGKPDPRFGDVMIRPKQQVRLRASKVLYDTYHITTFNESPSHLYAPHLYARPVPLDEPGIDCFSLRNTSGEDPDLDPLDFQSVDDIASWTEAQIHGGVTIDDIAEVHFSKPIEDKKRREKIKKQLDTYSIKHNL